jgi:uncharacterized protein YukE
MNSKPEKLDFYEKTDIFLTFILGFVTVFCAIQAIYCIIQAVVIALGIKGYSGSMEAPTWPVYLLATVLPAIIGGAFIVYKTKSGQNYKKIIKAFEEKIGDINKKIGDTSSGTLSSKLSDSGALSNRFSELSKDIGVSDTTRHESLTGQHNRILSGVERLTGNLDEVKKSSEALTGDQKKLAESVENLKGFAEILAQTEQRAQGFEAKCSQFEAKYSQLEMEFAEVKAENSCLRKSNDKLTSQLADLAHVGMPTEIVQDGAEGPRAAAFHEGSAGIEEADELEFEP